MDVYDLNKAKKKKPNKPAFEAALKILKRREYSEYELKQKLYEKGYWSRDIKEAVNECQQRRYLSDERFAEMMIRSRLMQGYGKRYIENELVGEKRVTATLVFHVMESLNVDWRLHARIVARKKRIMLEHSLPQVTVRSERNSSFPATARNAESEAPASSLQCYKKASPKKCMQLSPQQVIIRRLKGYMLRRGFSQEETNAATAEDVTTTKSGSVIRQTIGGLYKEQNMSIGTYDGNVLSSSSRYLFQPKEVMPIEVNEKSQRRPNDFLSEIDLLPTFDSKVRPGVSQNKRLGAPVVKSPALTKPQRHFRQDGKGVTNFDNNFAERVSSPLSSVDMGLTSGNATGRPFVTNDSTAPMSPACYTDTIQTLQQMIDDVMKRDSRSPVRKTGDRFAVLAQSATVNTQLLSMLFPVLFLVRICVLVNY